MKINITFTFLFMFSFLFVKGQQATNSAGNHYSSGNNVLTFSSGEFINEQFKSSNFSLKAGVIQSFSATCPIPNTFAFQQLNNLCIPEDGAVSLALSGSEPNVRYQLRLNGNTFGDSIVGTGNALSLVNASQSGIYTVRASYSGKSCFVDMPQQITLQASPQVTIISPSVAICAGQNTSIQLTSAENVFVNYSLPGGATQRVNITATTLSVPIPNAQVGTSIAISSVESVATGCINNTFSSLPIPVSPVPTIALSQTKIPCAGEVVELNYSSSEALSFSYNLNGTPNQRTVTALSGVISLQSITSDDNITLNNITSLQSGCQNISPLSFPFKVYQNPVISVFNISACSDESFSLALSSSANIWVSWRAIYNGATGGIGTGTAVGTLSEKLMNEGTTPIQVNYELTPAILNNPTCIGNPVISTVTINPAPQIISPANIPAICGGAVINVPVSSSGGDAVKWKRLNSLISGTGDILDIAKNTTNQPIILNYALELSGCNNVITKTVSVSVSPEPVLNINQIPSLCDAFIDLTQSAITTGSSAGIQLQYFQDANLSIPVADATKVSQGTYFIKGQLAGCSTKSSISIRSQVKLKVIEPQTICPDKSIDLAQYVDIAGSTPGLRLTYWTNAEATTAVVNPRSIGAGTYYVKGQAESTSCVIVKPIRVKAYVSESVTPPTDLTVCSGSVFDFTPSLKESTFKWFRNVNSSLDLSPNAGTGSISELLTIVNAEPEVELSYGYSVGAPGCDATVGTFKVKVTKGPSFELVDAPKICDAYINLNSLIKSPVANVSFSYFLNDSRVVDLTKGIQGNYRIEGVDAKGCKTSKAITVNHELEVPKVAPFISCPPLTVDLKTKLTDLFGSSFTVSYENITSPEKVNAGIYAVGLKPLNSACKVILPVVVQSGQPQITNPIAAVSLCSGEKFSFEPAFPTKDIPYAWSYQNGSGNGKVEAVWNNTSTAILTDSIKIVSSSSLCNQSASQFIKVDVQSAPPKLVINASDICADKPLAISVLASPENPSAKFSWKATYSLVQGGFNGNAVNSFGSQAIVENLYHEEDTSVTVKYVFQSFFPGSKTCYSASESISIEVLPLGFGPCAATLAGIIKTINKQFIEGVKVQVSGLSGDKIVNTRNDGLFKFSGLDNGEDYTIYPELNKNPLNGVSTFDLLLIQKHVLNTKKIENPYELIAADVNKSGSISIIDMLQLRKIILGVDKEFKENKSWRFVDANFTFRKEASPYQFPEIVNINDLNGTAEAHFYGIKIGDINGNAVANGSGLGDTRDQQEYLLQAENKMLVAGETYPLTIYADPLLPAEGMQFTLQYDPKKVQFESSLTDSILLSMMGVFEEEGLLTLSW
ncbi:MAG: PKD-like domain-containing protein, partial [Saprospiraceae bacterium]